MLLIVPNCFRYVLCFLFFCLLLGGKEAIASEEVTCVYGMDSSGEEAWLAIRIDIPENQALSGFLWYNNDEQVVFPSVRLGTGFEEAPGQVDDFVVVAENVQGVSSGWSELVFTEPIGASLDAVYLAFRFPPDQVLETRGSGGGPGFGYFDSSVGCQGWLSGDGEVWAKLHENYSFAAHPVFVPFEEGMAVKSFNGEEVEIQNPVIENYFLASPNPFNPETNFSFGLVKDGVVSIDVYDLHGRNVVQLFSGQLGAGRHNIPWQGRDTAGRGVSSGVYFVRFVGEGFNFKQKILLVR